jgi:hypothetical protein
MKRDYGGIFGLALVAFLGAAALVNLLPSPKSAPDMVANLINPCTADSSQCYSIQGLYSQQGCPGQHPWYVEASDHWFFMGCQ